MPSIRSLRPVWWLTAVTGLAAAFRVLRLHRPDTLVFDEAFYVTDAQRYLGTLDGAEISWVHPPLGKWLIAWGIGLAGDGPVGWRLAPFLAGVATVALTFALGRRLLGLAWGSVAALFVAVDGLAIVQSRTAMLDSFLAPLLLGALLVLLPVLAPELASDPDPDRGPDADPDRETDPDAGCGTDPDTDRGEAVSQTSGGLAAGDGWTDHDRYWLSWRLLAGGALLAAAVAVKWSAAPAMAAVAAVTLVRLRLTDLRRVLTLAAAFVVVPLAVYAAAYARFWSAEGPDVSGFVRVHRWMLEYHQNLTETHGYGSGASSWLLLRRPVAYSYESSGDTVTEILAVGNPVLWWGFLAAIPFIAVAWWRRREIVLEIVVGAVATLYVPWLVTFRQGFLFYLTPLVPFMALGLAWALRTLWRRGGGWRIPAAAVPVGAVTVGLLYLPLWVGWPISRAYWDRLILFDSWI